MVVMDQQVQTIQVVAVVAQFAVELLHQHLVKEVQEVLEQQVQ